ncbi:MAG: hypothetical protein HQL43_10695 [Alphaproteobacteria bacterium]|nr:hypothetical protein [Alphaproteobacteria bacterium]
MKGFLLLVALLAVPSLAFAKPKGCMTKAEQTVEWQIRHGIRLREFAFRCDEPPYNAGTLAIWRRIDATQTGQFQKMTDSRAKTFEREFPQTFKSYIEAWNGRIIMRYRDYYLSDIDCIQTKRQLQDIEKKGFKAFTTLSARYKPEILMDYRTCQ